MYILNALTTNRSSVKSIFRENSYAPRWRVSPPRARLSFEIRETYVEIARRYFIGKLGFALAHHTYRTSRANNPRVYFDPKYRCRAKPPPPSAGESISRDPHRRDEKTRKKKKKKRHRQPPLPRFLGVPDGIPRAILSAGDDRRGRATETGRRLSSIITEPVNSPSCSVARGAKDRVRRRDGKPYSHLSSFAP